MTDERDKRLLSGVLCVIFVVVAALVLFAVAKLVATSRLAEVIPEPTTKLSEEEFGIATRCTRLAAVRAALRAARGVKR